MIRIATIETKDWHGFPMELKVIYNMRPVYFFDLVTNWMKLDARKTKTSFYTYVASVANEANEKIEPDKKSWWVLPYYKSKVFLKAFGYDIEWAIQSTADQA
jgi:hypothetical protein